MSTYQIAWKASTHTATIQAKGDALPAGSVKISEFHHNDSQDGLGDNPAGSPKLAENHVFYHHVRDALYALTPSIQNMQNVQIEQDVTYTAVTGVTRTSSATPAINVAQTHQITWTIQPGGASNTGVTFSSASPNKATVSATGLVTGVQAGTSVITITTVDGGFTQTLTVTVS